MGIQIGIVDVPFPVASGPARRLCLHRRRGEARVKQRVRLTRPLLFRMLAQTRGVETMASDLQEIEHAVQTYFDGLYQGDTAKLAAVFHEEAHLFSVTDGKLDDMPRAAWFAMVSSRASALSRDLPRRDWVVQIDRSGPNTAFAKVQCQIPPRYFTDYLTFVKLADGWRVISKTFHTETH
jgi:hypothetical protein